MARIAFLIDETSSADGVRQLEERLRAFGHEVVRLTGEGEADGDPGTMGVDVARAADFDGVIVPGGFRRDHFRTHERFLNFLRDAYAAGHPVAAVHPDLWVLVPTAPTKVTWPAIKRALIVEPGERGFADDFGVQPLKFGAVEKLDDLVAALSAQLGGDSAGAATSGS